MKQTCSRKNYFV